MPFLSVFVVLVIIIWLGYIPYQFYLLVLLFHYGLIMLRGAGQTAAVVEGVSPLE